MTMATTEIVEEYGAIVAADKQNGIMVSVNNHGYKTWIESSPGKYKLMKEFEEHPIHGPIILREDISLIRITELAQEILEQINGNT